MKFANAKGIKIVFIAPPLQESRRSEENKWKKVSSYLKQEGLGDLFDGYFENICYLPNSCYVDGLHFKREYLDKNRSQIIDEMKQFN